LLGAAAIELQVLLGHGISMPGDVRIVVMASEILHILAAGAWLGGLLPLAILVANLEPARSASCVRRFSSLGAACVAALAMSSLIQAWFLIGGLPGLIGTDYGRLASVKLVLFIGLLTLAALPATEIGRSERRSNPAAFGTEHLHRNCSRPQRAGAGWHAADVGPGHS
jgi:putative copper resistance protein D